MGIVRTTAYPSRYADETWKEEPQPYMEQIDKFSLRFDALNANARPTAFVNRARIQRDLAALIGGATGGKPEYVRLGRFYGIGDWTVHGNTVLSGLFTIEDTERVLRVLTALGDGGWGPDGEVLIHFHPETYDRRMVLNLYNIMEARSRLIALALHLPEELKIIIGQDLALSVPLSAFSLEAVEACVVLLRQAALQACSVGKARMQPCDMTNPKYQMRSWLLRLGFIGDAFNRPRQTLLGDLPGNGAFFDEASKQKAAAKRKALGSAR